MTFDQIQLKFTQGLNWNGFLYVIYKVLSTGLSFLLYAKLTTADFSLWANINSLVFLTLLWIDCGFRKSLPRFFPEFAKDQKSLVRFTATILRFQIIMLVGTLFIFISLQNYIIGQSNTPLVFALGGTLLLTEGIIAIIRLVFHSQFLIKQFNIMSTIIIVGEMITSYGIVAYIKDSLSITMAVITCKVVFGLALILAALIALKKLYKNGEQFESSSTPIDYEKIKKEFIKHSGVMWANNAIKSITERNFMVPLLTTVLGPVQANMFKVANDGALLFYRTVIKTIGTTDTSLFSYVKQLPDSKKLMPIAFKKLMLSIVVLCLPFLGITLLLSVFSSYLFSDKFVFQLFTTITVAYLIESMLSPFERILEVNRRYLQLFFAYTPYIIMLLILLYFNIIPSIGLVMSIIIIHGVRLVSSLLMISPALTYLRSR